MKEAPAQASGVSVPLFTMHGFHPALSIATFCSQGCAHFCAKNHLGQIVMLCCLHPHIWAESCDEAVSRNHNITSPRHVTASRGVNTADSREQPRGRTCHVMFQSMAAVNGQFSHLLLQLNQEPVCKEAEMKWKNCYFTIIGAQWTRLVDTIIIIFIPENFRQSDLFSFNLSIKLWEPATISRGGASDAPTNL